MVSFPSPWTFANRTDLKIIALKMSKFRSDKTAITFILFIDPQSLVRLMIDKEILIVDLKYFEQLCGFFGVIVEDKFVIVWI